jgi:integral membrane protein (TIGR01906 family)
VKESPSRSDPRVNESPGKAETTLFAVGFAMAGLVLLALVWSGAGAYADMARAAGAESTTFIDHVTGENVVMGLGPLVQEHRVWSTYVTGGIPDPPRPGRFYTADEISHMTDVRRVFDGAKILIPAGLFVMAIRMQRARTRSAEAMVRLVRDGAVAAGIAVAAIGIIAAFAFEQAFLLFHEVFFPQGNFLFDPATSNLVRLYPDWYWQGITFRIGLTFIALAAAVAVVASVGLRRARSTRLADA